MQLSLALLEQTGGGTGVDISLLACATMIVASHGATRSLFFLAGVSVLHVKHFLKLNVER